MKKAFSIFLSILILLSTGGFTLFMDYCPMMDKSNYSLSASDKTGCGCDFSGKCCKKNKIEGKKIQNDFIASSSNLVSPEILSIVPVFYYSSIALCEAATAKTFNYSHAPPGKSISRTIFFRSILV